MRVLVLRVFDNTDNLEIPLMAVAVAAEVFADWILVPEELLGEALVDNRDAGRRGRVLLADSAPSNQAGSDGLKVIRPDAQPGRIIAMLTAVVGTFRKIHRSVPIAAFQWGV